MGPRVQGVVQGNTFNGTFHDRGGTGSFQGQRSNFETGRLVEFMAAPPVRHRWAASSSACRREGRAGLQERPNRPGEISCISMPTVSRSRTGPRQSAVPGYSRDRQFQRRMEPQYLAGHLRVAVEPSPMQRRRSHLSRSIYRPTRLQHQSNCSWCCCSVRRWAVFAAPPSDSCPGRRPDFWRKEFRETPLRRPVRTPAPASIPAGSAPGATEKLAS
jgi:hypothetical protein